MGQKDKLVETYDTINDRLSLVNDLWSKHGITERFATLAIVITYLFLTIYATMNNVDLKGDVLFYLYQLTTWVILLHIIGVSGITKVADAFVKFKLAGKNCTSGTDVCSSCNSTTSTTQSK